MIERAKRGLSEMMPDEVRELDRQLTQRLEDKYGRENVEKAVKLIESTAIAAVVATNPELAVAKAMVEAYTGRDMVTNQPLTLAEKADRFAQAIPGYSALRSTFEVTSGYRLTDFERLSPQERALAGVAVAGAVLPAAKNALSNGNSVFANAAESSGAKIGRVLSQEEQAAASAVQQTSQAEQRAAGAAQDAAATGRQAAAPQSAWHVTDSASARAMVERGIDPARLNENNRFGKGFYVAEQPGTAAAEVAFHNGPATASTVGIRYNVDQSKLKVLDLTNSEIAAMRGYTGGSAQTADMKAIGKWASENGYNAIRFNSERAVGGTNLAIIGDFNEVLQPQMVSGVLP